MGATKQKVRTAGVLYLLMVPLGVFSLMYVSKQVAARGNASETVINILAHQNLIRLDLVVGLVTTVVFMLVALSLYQLLKDVNGRQAALMAILVLIQLPNAYVVQFLQLGALELARGEGILSTIDQPQRESLALLLSHLNDKGVVLSEFFWGVWLLPLGTLVYQSGFLSRFVGIWLLINGVAYIAMCGMNLFAPQYSDAIFKFAFPAMFGEVALTVELLIVGFRSKPLEVSGGA